MSDEKYISYKSKIISFYRKNRRMPGYKEIIALVGFKSKNAVYKLINKLVDDEVVDKDSSGRLTPVKVFGDIPLLGLVEAGIPTSVDPDTSESLNIDEYLVGNKEGDIVIEEVDGGWTIKYFKKKGNLIYLKPANKNYSPIYPQYDLKVAAIVKGVIRKY